MPKVILKTVLGLLLGVVLGGMAGCGIGSAYVTLFNVSDFEGYSGYVVFYCFVPVAIALIAPLTGAFFFARAFDAQAKHSKKEP